METKPEGSRPEASSPFIWPPTIYGSAALLSGLVSWFASWPFEPDGTRFELRAAGVVLIALGIASAVAAERRFHAAGTPVPPTRPTKALVFDGIYKYTRNPMYLGMVLALASAAWLLNGAAPWLVLAVFGAIIRLRFIRHEEALMARTFGDRYLAYRTRVRRWL